MPWAVLGLGQGSIGIHISKEGTACSEEEEESSSIAWAALAMVAWVQLGSQKGLETSAMLGFECRQFEFKLDANFIGFSMILQVRFTYNVFFLSNFFYSVSVVKMWVLGGDPRWAVRIAKPLGNPVAPTCCDAGSEATGGFAITESLESGSWKHCCSSPKRKS